MRFQTGDVYGNRYTLGERIAVGGMGEVWEATDQVLGRIVAIKLLSPALADQAGFAQRFREEARNTAALTHANIAAVYDYGEDEGANWLVMELVRGRPLSTIIAEDAPMGPERTSVIAAQAALALQAAHDRGVVHRDVKPANILVKNDGTVKLTDFGIARATDAAPITRTGEVMGTAQYISPEQAQGKAVSPASDLYALGCVIYEMLTGKRPFDEGSPVATAMAHVSSPPPPLPSRVPQNLADIVMMCLAKDPAARPASGQAVSDMLRGAPTGSFPATAPIAVTERLAPATRVAPRGRVASTVAGATVAEPAADSKRGLWWWLIPALLLLAALAAFALLGRDNTTSTPTTPPATTIIITTTQPSEPTSEPSTPETTDEPTTPSQTTTTDTPTHSTTTTSPTKTPSSTSTTSEPSAPETTQPTQTAPPAATTTDTPAAQPQAPTQNTQDAPATGAQAAPGPAGAGVGIPGSRHPETTTSPTP